MASDGTAGETKRTEKTGARSAPRSDGAGRGAAGKASRVASRYVAVQRKAGASAPNDPKEVTAAASQGISGGGSPLPNRSQLEAGFGTDLSDVRVHSGAQAASASRAIGAEAYTMGNDIALATPSPSPALVAHEVAHVIQQRAGAVPSSGVGTAGDSFEREADVAAASVASGGKSDLGRRYSTRDAAGAVQSKAVQRYESSEHAQTADGMQYPLVLSEMKLPNGAMVTRGELVAFGDFYQDFEHLTVAPRQETECLAGLIRWEGMWRLAGRQARHTKIGSSAGPLADPSKKDLDAARHNTKDGGDKHMLDTSVEHGELEWTDKAWDVAVNGIKLRERAKQIHAQFAPAWEFMGISMPQNKLPEVSLTIAHLRSTLGRRRFRNANNTLGSSTLPDGTPATTDPKTSDPSNAGGDYFDLASNNLSHFAVTNWATWSHFHKECCDTVKGKPGDPKVKSLAVMKDALACHYLTDMFATGHMLDKQELMTFATDMMVGMSKAKGLSKDGDNKHEVVENMLTEAMQMCFRDPEVYEGWRKGCKNAFDQNLIAYSEMELMLTIPRGTQWAHGKTVVGNLVATIMGMPWRNNQSNKKPGGGKAEAFGPGNEKNGMGDYHLGVGNLAAKKAHDCLNAVGFTVKNENGAVWDMKGDGHLTAATQAQAKLAVDESTRQVEAGAFNEAGVKKFMPRWGKLSVQAVKDYYKGGKRGSVVFNPDKLKALFAVVNKAAAGWFELTGAKTVSPMMRDLAHAIMEVEFTAHPEEYDSEVKKEERKALDGSGDGTASMTNTGINISMLRDFLKDALPLMVPAAYASASAADMPSAALEIYKPRDAGGKILPTGANDFAWDGSKCSFKLNVTGCDPGTYTIGIIVRDQDSGIDYLPSGQLEASPAGRNTDSSHGTFAHTITVPKGAKAHSNGNSYVDTTFTLKGDANHGEHYLMVYADKSCKMIIGRSAPRDSGKTSNPIPDAKAPKVTGADATKREFYRATGIYNNAIAWDGNTARFRVTHNSPDTGSGDNIPIRMWIRQFNRDSGYDYDKHGREIPTEFFEPRDDDDEIGSATMVSAKKVMLDKDRVSEHVLFAAEDNDNDTYIIVYADAGCKQPLGRSNVQGTNRGKVDNAAPINAATGVSGFSWSGKTLSFVVSPPTAKKVYVKFHDKDFGFDYDTKGKLLSGSRDEDELIGGVRPVSVSKGRASITVSGDADDSGDTYAIVYSDPGCSTPLGRSGVQP